MNKNLVFLLAFALASCNTADAPDSGSYGTAREKTFRAAASPVVSTRTNLAGDGLNVEWNAGDQIGIWDGVTNRLFTVSGPGASVEISGTASDASSYYAMYPYTNTRPFNKNDNPLTASVTVPSEQTAAAGTFAPGSNLTAAVSDDKTSFHFQNLLSVAHLTINSAHLDGHGIRSIRISSGQILSGAARITFGSTCTIAADNTVSKSVTLSSEDGSALQDGSYYICLLPNAGGEFTIDFTDTEGNVATRTSSFSKAFSAGVIKNIGTVTGLDWQSSTATNVTTVGADAIGTSSATLSGSYSNAAATPAYKGFEWGVSPTSLTNDRQSETSLSGTSGSFSATIEDLSSNTTYYYRAYIGVLENGSYKYYYGQVKSFTTSPPNQGGEGDQKGWFELPYMDYSQTGDGYLVDDSDSNLYYAYHSVDELRNYTVCYSGQYHCPVWVAAPRHSCYVGSSGRSEYSKDPDIPSEVQQAQSSGGNSTYNRGHILGSAERTVSKAVNKQVFYYTNIAPQRLSNFNTGGGGWNRLEDFIDGLVPSDTLYTVIGCYFEDYTDGHGFSASKHSTTFMGSTVQVPTMFYYALLRTKNGNSGKKVSECSASELQCVAFVRSHSSSWTTGNSAVTAADLMSIDELEALTGIDYFPNVPNAPESSYNASDWGL